MPYLKVRIALLVATVAALVWSVAHTLPHWPPHWWLVGMWVLTVSVLAYCAALVVKEVRDRRFSRGGPCGHGEREVR